MIRDVAARIRRVPELWRKLAVAGGVYLFCEVGARVGLPGLNGSALADFLRRGGNGNGLLPIYDRFVGGALSRGAVLGLGIMPYVSARIMMRLSRLIPSVDRLWRDDEVRFNGWTRALTVSLSLVQSYGIAVFVQSIPGAVANPGVGFIGQTMALLTAGAVVTMALAERITRRSDDEPGGLTEAELLLTPPLQPVPVRPEPVPSAPGRSEG